MFRSDTGFGAPRGLTAPRCRGAARRSLGAAPQARSRHEGQLPRGPPRP